MNTEENSLLFALQQMNAATQEVDVYKNILENTPVLQVTYDYIAYLDTLQTQQEKDDSIYSIFCVRFDEVPEPLHVNYITQAESVGIGVQMNAICNRRKEPAK